MSKELLMGNQVFAHAALEAGVNVVAGYPGTPSSEVIETVASMRAQGRAKGVYVEWSTNEKAALELAAGATYCGARALFTCKQVGLNVAGDALMSLTYVGVEGGMVVFAADDPGPISSQTEQDTRRFASFAKVPVLDPATPEQGAMMMRVAFELSELYRTPVIVRPTTRICHSSTFIEVHDETEARPVPDEGFVKDPKWVIFPKRSYEAHGEINQRLKKIASIFSSKAPFALFNSVVEGGTEMDFAFRPGCMIAEDSPKFKVNKVGIVAGGVSYAYAQDALSLIEDVAAEAGLKVPRYKLMQIGTPYPFPEVAAKKFAEDLDAVIVFEELDHVIEDEFLKMAGKNHLPLKVCGKLTGNARDRGENSVEDIASRIADFLDSAMEGRFTIEMGGAGADSLDPSEAEAMGECATCPLSTECPSSKKIPHPGEGPLATQVAARLSRSCFSTDSALSDLDSLLPVRPPVLCAGCPHRGSFYAVKQALAGRKAVLCGDIGCYTLGNAAPLDAVDTCLCMGAGITMAQGFSVIEPHKKQLAFVGDSTFFASALTEVVNAVYNGHDITVVVLDNSTTAMTGTQPHPGTGVTLMGEHRDPIDIEGLLRAMGVRTVVTADPLDHEAAVAAAIEAIDADGPSALIFRSPCIQISRSQAPVHVDAETCTGCRKCITEIGCPGIGFAPDAEGPKSGSRGQAFIDVDLCNGCGLCIQICPFGAIVGSDSPEALEQGGRQ